MNEYTVIDVKNLTKTYHLYKRHSDRVKETFHPFRKKYHRPFNALKNVSVHINKGETFGIIGRNGSGKSTLLQIICGILQPTLGKVEVKGRISALLELGAGFNPEFTGRQNVYIKSAMLGLKREEIDARFSDIADFSEIGDFLEQPVKTYSSGMYVRLAFAIAISVDPDILVIDEALAVGDAAFQYKCFRRFEELRKIGTTILFVTHSVGAVKKLCNRAIWLHDGKLVADSEAVSVADQYEDFIRKQSVTQTKKDNNRQDGDISTQTVSPENNQLIGRALEVRLLDELGNEISNIVSGKNLTVSIRYEVYADVPEGIIIAFGLHRVDNIFVCGVNSGLDKFEAPASQGIHHVSLKLIKLPLLSGTYYLQAGLFDKSGMVFWDLEPLTKELVVSSPYTAEGVVKMEHCWELIHE